MATGNVEVVTGIPADTTVRLVPHLFPDHVMFLELAYSPGDTTATVRTKMELDADALKSVRFIISVNFDMYIHKYVDISQDLVCVLNLDA